MCSPEPTHLRDTRCILCRQSAPDGGSILDPDGVYYTAHNCQNRCVSCDGFSTPHMWLHQQCHELLLASYLPGTQPGLADLEDFGDAMPRVYRSRGTESPTSMVACIQEGLLCHSVQRVLHDCFCQDRLRGLPAEILDLTAEAIGWCSYLVVLGESRRLIEELRRNPHRRDQFVVVDLNQDVDGYAACPRRFSPYWRYFPIHPGEYIQNVWIRKQKNDHKDPSYPEFALQTTRGRYALFGEYPAHGWVRNQSAYEFLPLTHPEDGLDSSLCRNGFDPDSSFISGYGVTCDPTIAPKSPASLSHVQACWSVARYYRRCLGLLLHYEDGSCESVGQFRWDQRISERIQAPIRLHVGRLGPWKKNRRFVLHAQSAVGGEARLPWGRGVDFPDSGFLVWWSGAIGDDVEVQRT
ncbi:hypothetical protein BJX96DRAFT_174774 [Aspergillus floccosus]